MTTLYRNLKFRRASRAIDGCWVRKCNRGMAVNVATGAKPNRYNVQYLTGVLAEGVSTEEHCFCE